MNKSPPRWTAEEVEFVLTFKSECSTLEMAEALGRTFKSVSNMRCKLNNPIAFHLGKKRAEDKKRASPSFKAYHRKYSQYKNNESIPLAAKHLEIWSIQDDQYLVDHLEDDRELVAAKLGRTLCSIGNRRSFLRAAGFFSMRLLDNPSSGDSIEAGKETQTTQAGA